MGHNFEKGIFFLLLYEVLSWYKLGRGGTRDLRSHQETKLHKHSEKDGVAVLPLQSYFGPIREESVICAEVLFAYFLGAPSCLSIGRSLYQTIQLMFPDSSIAKDVQSY